MKILLFLPLALLNSALVAQAQSKRPLTNDVPISEGGMRLVITDDDVSDVEKAFADLQVSADSQLHWVLHNTSLNETGVLFLGLSNSFAVTLFSQDGVSVAKTDAGRSMGRGPENPKDPYASRAKRIGPGPSRVDIMDFPALTNLFLFPSNGVYTLEAQYWCWWPSQQRFGLSAPVRLEVVKSGAHLGTSRSKKAATD